ncbi:acyl-[ACP]--phospholipid O-acyltransferase [Thalassotalea sp. Y01]|uniref:acyl-[ACP]--phospholipid O-acyltransferase n=1 Tax=Thalassotalea sp. Y01 TaxID=2729613 RepID=UPI00145E44FE|nr:acyl-[ACP]--phospholipid O-acyltransferase [Thalassotalea sp. Y01]NMP14916.1 acyl-[ACP]--phospholipid O-acyltransferase [Thalassotalea sp. Y01]
MKHLLGFKGFFAYIVMVFINAFVDLGHKIVVQNTVFKIYDGDLQIVLTAILNALILLPFIFLFSPSGHLADKYPKPHIMRISAIVAVVATSIITFCYFQGWFEAAFIMTLIMGIQSAIYSPAKYGYLKELIGVENLAQGNASVQAVTIVSILGGTFVFSALFEMMVPNASELNTTTIMQSVVWLGWGFVALSLVEWYYASKLPITKPKDDSKRLELNQYVKGKYLKDNLKLILSDRVIWLSIIGLSMFWSVSQVMLATFPAFAKEVLASDNALVVQGIMACTGIGIVIGSIIAAKVSKNHIELGLIPLSALAFTVSLAIIASLDSAYVMAVVFLIAGISGGLFIIPLNALIQYHAKEDQLGVVLAGNNWVQNVAMLTGLITTIGLVTWGISSVGVFYLLSALALAGALYTVWQLPHSLVRIIATFVMRRRYKLEVLGFEHLPSEGGVLLLGNHISWIDGLLVQMACPRKVRFVMLRSIYERWYVKPLVKLFGTIPISRGNSKESLAAVNEALKAGEVVCLFPEGAISRTGSLGVFRSGFERVVDDVEGAIIPFYLHGLWGSRMSRANSDKLRNNTINGLRRDVVIAFGQPLAMSTNAQELKQKVFELSFEAWEHQTKQTDPLPLGFIQSVMDTPSADAVVDSNGQAISYRKLLAACYAIAGNIKRLDDSQNIGLMLPSSSASVIANMAVLLNGQTVVNVNYTSSAEAVNAGMDNAAIKTVISSQKFLQKLNSKGVDTEAMLTNVNVVMMEDLKQQLSKVRLFTSMLATALLPARWYYYLLAKPVAINSPAAILFSSGSEGTPKGIVLSHRNFSANIRQISDVLRTKEDDVVMGTLPPFHSFGLTVTTFLPLLEGIKVVCHPDPTDVVNIAKTIAKQKATMLCATATFLRLYVRNRKVEPLMLDSLRTVVAGAEKLPEDVREQFKQKFSKDIYEGYGATETTPVASVNIPDQMDIGDFQVQTGSKQGTVGMPVPGCSFRIVDPVSMETLPAEDDGLILISGSQVMLGYLNDGEKTTEAIIELDGRRWYKTGDKGHLDKDGFLTIVDRYSRFAKIGGEMVSLTAVELQLANAVTDVEFVAVNIPDAKKGEAIIALTEHDIDLNEVKQLLIANHCNALMIPSKLFKVDALPKLGSGKTDFAASKKLALQLA